MKTQILPTILSRVQIIRLPRPSVPEIQEALISRAGVQPEQARQLAAVSEQNYREALRQLQHGQDDWQGLLREWLNAVLKNRARGPGKMGGRNQLKPVAKNKNSFCSISVTCWSRPYACACLMEHLADLPDSEKDFASRLNKIADLSAQQAIVEEINKSIYYIERNAHAKMLFHALTIRLYHILANREEAVVT